MKLGQRHELGWLTRVDVANEQSDLVDGFGTIIATVQTKWVQGYCENGKMARFHMAYIEQE